MAIIGLCGKPQAGKTEVRKMLESKFGFAPVCSKSVLYAISALVTGLPVEDFYRTDRKNELYRGQTHRQITGKLGNAIEGMFGDSFLVDRALEPVMTLQTDFRQYRYNWVLDSLRKEQTVGFPGFVVEVVSERSIETGNSFDEYNRSKIHYTIPNHGDLNLLERHVETMLKALGITNE